MKIKKSVYSIFLYFFIFCRFFIYFWEINNQAVKTLCIFYKLIFFLNIFIFKYFVTHYSQYTYNCLFFFFFYPFDCLNICLTLVKWKIVRISCMIEHQCKCMVKSFKLQCNWTSIQKSADIRLEQIFYVNRIQNIVNIT